MFARSARNLMSKKLPLALGLLAAAFALHLLAGCSLSFTDHANTDQPAHVSAGGTGCLESALQTIQDYPSGKASDDQVSSAWACGINALDTFSHLATGKDVNYYSAQSLRSFLEEKFLGKTKISDGLLSESMLIKQVLLGGGADRLTRDEVLKVRDSFKSLQAETVALLPYIRILTLKEKAGTPEAAPEKVSAALKQLEKSSIVLGGLLSQARVPYDLTHLKSFMTEIQALYKNGSGWNGPQFFIDNINVIYHVKALMVRPEGQIVAEDEWNPLFVRGSELFAIFLRIQYLMNVDQLLNGDGLKELKATIEHSFGTLNEAVLSKADHVINYETIDPVIDDVLHAGIVNWKVKAPTWKGIVRVIFERVLNPPRGTTGARPEPGRVTINSLALAKELVEGWLETQREWGLLVSQVTASDPKLVRGNSIPLNLVAELWPQMISKAPKQHADLDRLFQRKFPIVYTPEGVVVFEQDRGKVSVDQTMFNSINWKQSFIRAVVMGYASAPEINRYKGLTLDEFHSFYTDGRSLGVDLGFLDPSDENVWSSIFVELNIFTISSDGGTGDGSNYLSFSEGVDFISNAVSSATSAHFFYAELLNNCVHQSPDVFGVPRWTAQCYRERFKKSFTSFYRYLPQWTKMVAKFTPAQMDAFQQDFERAARKLGISDELVESTDVDRGTMIMHYIESLYDRFDKDQSGTLNYDEAKLAFPLLRDLLAQAADSQDDGRLIALYTYLMANGHAPTTIIEKAYFITIWENFPSLWRFEADRQQLVKIVASINQTAKH